MGMQRSTAACGHSSQCTTAQTAPGAGVLIVGGSASHPRRSGRPARSHRCRAADTSRRARSRRRTQPPDRPRSGAAGATDDRWSRRTRPGPVTLEAAPNPAGSLRRDGLRGR
jgi:hypothetical protein